ncbi:serine proteinase stubble-like [Paramacrobiotus metropolitanus]|uniref:serine proteinase stubble-like n=1 Tax=Paramacrobiotus metropolitanus TaxID=2943436 RepID=UPI0024455F1C|nr:serine proteinase stubble-like [Paramacrobiotus metropolitanus]
MVPYWLLTFYPAAFIVICPLLYLRPVDAQDIQSAPLQYISYSAVPRLPFSENLLRLRDGTNIMGATRTARTESLRSYDTCPANSECTFMSKCTTLRRVQPTVRCDVALNEMQSAISMRLPGGVCCRTKMSAASSADTMVNSQTSLFTPVTSGESSYLPNSNRKSGHLVNFVQSPNSAGVHYAPGSKTPLIFTDPGKESSVSYIPGEAPVNKIKQKMDAVVPAADELMIPKPVATEPSKLPIEGSVPLAVLTPPPPKPISATANQNPPPPSNDAPNTQVLFQTAAISQETPPPNTTPQPLPAGGFSPPQPQWVYSVPTNQQQYNAPVQQIYNAPVSPQPPQMPMQWPVQQIPAAPAQPMQSTGVQNTMGILPNLAGNPFPAFPGGQNRPVIEMVQQNGQLIQTFSGFPSAQLFQPAQPAQNYTVLQQNPPVPPPMPAPAPSSNPPGIPSDTQQTFCGVRDNLFTQGRSPRVLGGRPSEFGAWPWMAVISSSKRLRCGATILNEQFLVTAAHCVYKNFQYGYYQDLSVQIGIFSMDDYQPPQFQPETVRILRVFIHPLFNTSQSSFDVALIQLTQPIVFKPHIKPICLPSFEHVGEMGTVLGWGKRKETDDRSNLPTVLQEVDMPILYPWQCILELRSNKIFDDVGPQFVCAGGKANQDACRGDSGGPLLALTKGQFWEIVGIVSKGYGCGKENVPGIYTNIWFLKDWIETTVASNWNTFNIFNPFFLRDRSDVFNNYFR